MAGRPAKAINWKLREMVRSSPSLSSTTVCTQDEYDPYVYVARVQKIDGGFRVRLFYLDAEEPTTCNDYPNDQELFDALDQAVEARSQEVGPLEASEP